MEVNGVKVSDVLNKAGKVAPQSPQELAEKYFILARGKGHIYAEGFLEKIAFEYNTYRDDMPEVTSEDLYQVVCRIEIAKIKEGADRRFGLSTGI